jgi:hypothetical protein
MSFRNALVTFLGFAFAGACCLAFAILIGNIKQTSHPIAAPSNYVDPIVDIWINRRQGFFFVFLPDNTAKIYESYSFDLDNVGKWQRVEDRPIYPESPKIHLPSYKAIFEDGRVIDVFLYSIFHHDSIVVEDRITGPRGYNRLSDTDDANGFYHKKFTRGLPQDLTIVNGYWKTHHGHRSH